MAEVAQPPRRGPGRPKKVAEPKVEAAPTADAWRTVELDAIDRERMAESVGDRASFLSFPDGREYRCEGGKVVERVH